MTDMNVSMKLTMAADTASPQLKQFNGVVESAIAKINALNEKFAAFSASSRAFNQNIGASSRGVSTFSANTDKLEASLGLMTERLTAAINRMTSFAESTGAARASAAGLGTEIRSANGALDVMSAKAEKTAGSFRMLAEAWAALKIEKGIRSSVRAASDFETQKAQIRDIYGADQANYAANQAMRQKLSYISPSEALAARRAIIGGTGQNNEALQNAILPDLLKNAYIYKNLVKPGANIGDVVANMMGLAEARGMSQSSGGIKAAAEQAVRVAIATQGRMGLGAQEVVARQYKYGGAQNVNQQGYQMMMALAEQYTTAGHEGGGGGGRGISQVGTALSMLTKIQNITKLNKVTKGLLEQMDMMTSGGTESGTTTTSTNTTSMIRGAIEGQKNPLKWAHDVLVPRMLAFVTKNASKYFEGGVASVDPEAQRLALNRLAIQMFGPTGGVNVSNMISMASNPAVYSRMTNMDTQANNAAIGDQGISRLNKFKMAMDSASSATDKLKIAMSQGLLPVLASAAQWFADTVAAIGNWMNANKDAASAITALAAAISGVMALRVAAWLARAVGLTEMLGTASIVAATTWSARVAAMGAVALRFAGIVGVAFALYEGVRSLQMAGVSMQNTVAALVDALVSQFASFFLFLSEGFDKVANTIHNTVADAVNGAQRAAQFLGIGGYVHPGGARQWMSKSNSSSGMTKWIKSFRDNLDNAGVDALTYRAPKERGPYSAPNLEHLAALNQNDAAQQYLSKVGGMPNLGASTRKHGEKSAARKAAEQMQRALDFLRNQQASGDPIQQIKNKFAPNIAALSNGGRVDLAAQLEGIQNTQIATETKKLQKKKLELLKKQLKQLQSELGDKQAQNAALVTAGVLTPDQAQRRTIADQKAAAPDLLKAAQAVRDYEKAIGESTTKIDTAIIKINEMGHSLTQLQSKISNTVQGAFQSFFDQLMGGKTSWKNMGKKFVENIMNGVNSAVSQNLSQSLIQGLFGSSTGAGQALRGFGGSGQIMSGIGSFLGNMFGSGGGGVSQQQSMLNAQWPGSSGSSSSSGWMSALGSIAGSFLSSFAVGADNIPNDMVAQIHKGEMIIPAAGAEAIRSGKLGGQGHTINMNIHAMDSQSVLGAMDGIKRDLANMLNSTNANLNLGM